MYNNKMYTYMFEDVAYQGQWKHFKIHRLRIQTLLLLEVAVLVLKPGPSDGFGPLTLSIWRDFTVRVQKNRPVVDALGH